MRERLLDAAEKMAQDRGLHAISFQSLADAVGLRKPSVFHHFPNKEAIVEALLQRCQVHYTQLYQPIVESKASALEKLRAIARAFEAGLKEDRLCLLGTLASGRDGLSEASRNDLQQRTEATLTRYASVFRQGREEGSLRFAGSPEAAATVFLSLMQGLQVLERSRKRQNGFRKAADSYLRSLTP
ncbi:MAG: TetR/AcrR family transcriptional regulator [Planctomycetota bacterium]|nr:MAG: TetR/AcrR family transcriptional regulator [Planctomycetota bacterium]